MKDQTPEPSSDERAAEESFEAYRADGYKCCESCGRVATNSERAFKAGHVAGLKAAREEQFKHRDRQKTEDYYLDIIQEWRFSWMDVKGTDERDRKNYLHRAMGVDANMRYDLARRLMKEKK